MDFNRFLERYFYEMESGKINSGYGKRYAPYMSTENVSKYFFDNYVNQNDYPKNYTFPYAGTKEQIDNAMKLVPKENQTLFGYARSSNDWKFDEVVYRESFNDLNSKQRLPENWSELSQEMANTVVAIRGGKVNQGGKSLSPSNIYLSPNSIHKYGTLSGLYIEGAINQRSPKKFIEYVDMARRNIGAETLSNQAFRVQGGGLGYRSSQQRLTVNRDGGISINNQCSGQLCISINGPSHASYYLNNRQGGNVTVFDISGEFKQQLIDSLVLQQGAKGTNSPKITDVGKGSPSISIELPRSWNKKLEQHSSNGRVLSQEEFNKEFNNEK